MNCKLVIYGSNMYKEVIFDDGFQGVLTIGTDKACQIAFRRERFVSGFIVRIDRREDGQYMISCSDTVYLSKDSNIREYVRPLELGDHISLFYDATDAEFMGLDFLPLFDRVGDDFNQEIKVGGLAEFSIGGQVGCTIRVDDARLLNDTVKLRKVLDGYEVDFREANLGVEVNGFTSREEIALIRNGEFLSIRGYVFCIENGVVYTTEAANILTECSKKIISYQKNHYRYPKFIKNVRQQFKLPDEEIEILDPKEKEEDKDKSFILTILPMLVSLVLMIFLRTFMPGNKMFVLYFVGIIGASIAVTIVGHLDEKKKSTSKEEKRRKSYMEYLSQREDDIIKLREREQKVSNNMNPKLSDYMTYIDDFSNRLFEKKKDHDDYLKVRLGEGVVKSNCQVKYKEEDFIDTEDDLKDFPKAMHTKYEYISSMPVCLDLKTVNAVGFIGNRTKLYQIEKNLIIEFAASHFYNDLKLFLIMDENDTEYFSWARWLKATYNEDTKMRNFMYDSDSAKLTLEFLYSELSRREAMENIPEDMPVYIVFVYRSEQISNHPVSKFIGKANELGFRFVFFEEYEEFLNESCAERIFLNDDGNTGYIQKADDGENIQNFSYEHVPGDDAEKAAKKLAAVYVDEVSLENTLTRNITLFQLLGIMSPYDLNLKERWNSSEIYKSMAAPLGVKSGNEVVYLDLHEKYHGPHGLVAGTTGSGKSEILQSYILSMATLFHPYEVGFIIIDFKGGGMVNQFRNLPHLNGAITNIDGNEVERSLLSIKAELVKRQKLFAEQDVNHIDDYIRAYKEGRAATPLPHLILIVDEFAELKSEQPEFMKELISAARIGRSLGVHLILATQKPSGVVSDQIWSNSKFKLCLKVQNAADSNEVLKSPLAAEIREPGRAYLQVGNNELFQLFQSAYSGGSAKNDGITSEKKFRLSMVELSGRRRTIYEQNPNNDEAGETELKALVNYISEYCEENGIERLPNICMPSLGESIPITMDGFRNSGTDVVVPIGITDDPSNQNQYIETYNPSQENFYILGSSQSGKTNLVQTIIRGLAENYSPHDVNIYIIDFASMILRNYADLNHVGGVITPSDDDKLNVFMKFIIETIQTRKKLLAKMGLSSYSAYRETGRSEIPQIVVVLENWVAFRSYFPDYEDAVISICRDSVAAGISFVVTVAQGNGAGFKLVSNFSKRTALYCNDSSDYGTIFESCRKKLPDIPGRAIVEANKTFYECQYYLSFPAEKEYEKISLIREFIRQVAEKYEGMYVKGIPEMPEKVTEAFFKKQFGETAAYEVPLGMEFEAFDKRTIKLDSQFVYGFVGGKDGRNKIYIRYLLNSLLAGDEPLMLYLIDDPQSEFKDMEAKTAGYANTVQGTTEILKNVVALLMERAEKSKAGTLNLKSESLICIVINSPVIVKSLGSEKELSDFIKLIIQNLKGYKVCFILSNLENTMISFKDSDLLKQMRTDRTLVAFEDIPNIKVLDVPVAVSRQYKKQLEAGDAYLFTEDGLEKIRVIEG